MGPIIIHPISVVYLARSTAPPAKLSMSVILVLMGIITILLNYVQPVPNLCLSACSARWTLCSMNTIALPALMAILSMTINYARVVHWSCLIACNATTVVIVKIVVVTIIFSVQTQANVNCAVS